MKDIYFTTNDIRIIKRVIAKMNNNILEIKVLMKEIFEEIEEEESKNEILEVINQIDSMNYNDIDKKTSFTSSFYFLGLFKTLEIEKNYQFKQIIESFNDKSYYKRIEKKEQFKGFDNLNNEFKEYNVLIIDIGKYPFKLNFIEKIETIYKLEELLEEELVEEIVEEVV